MNRAKLRPIRVGFSCIPAALVALWVIGGASAAMATEVIFTIDPTQSTETWSGTDNLWGAFQPQYPGSLSSAISGHFLVTFDPTNDTPTSIQFDGGHGYFQLASTNQGFPGPPPTFIGPAPANVSGATPGAFAAFSIRNLVWDFNSAPIAGAGGVFPATSTFFTTLTGKNDSYANVLGAPVFTSTQYAGGTGHVTAGNWTLSESAPGSGNWTLGSNGSYTYSYSNGADSGQFTASGVTVSKAQFGAANTTTVPQPVGAPVVAQVLGGAAATGGVTAVFPANSTGGTLSAQLVPNNTALSQAAITSGTENPVFSLSTQSLSVNPQIWDVQFGGNLNGGMSVLTFHYDPLLLPVGTDQTKLGIWHYSSIRDQWEFGGTVNTVNDTITYTTDGFSPFEVGLNVPEPSTIVLAGAALLPLAYIVWRRRRRMAMV